MTEETCWPKSLYYNEVIWPSKVEESQSEQSANRNWNVSAGATVANRIPQALCQKPKTTLKFPTLKNLEKSQHISKWTCTDLFLWEADTLKRMTTTSSYRLEPIEPYWWYSTLLNIIDVHLCYHVSGPSHNIDRQPRRLKRWDCISYGRVVLLQTLLGLPHHFPCPRISLWWLHFNSG